MAVVSRRLSRIGNAMLFALVIILLVAGGGVSGTTPKRPPPSKCLSPAARDKVPPLKCGPNSYFERCSKVCPPQNCSTLLDPNWLCESPCCVPECRCYDGYLHDDRTGQCISRDECLAQCGPSERFVKDSTECQMTCANYMVTGPRRICKPFTGCVCGEGRVRLNDDGTGECVLQQKCPRRRCPLNEHLEDCPGVCTNETCISKYVKTYKCLLPIIPQPCKPRCICDKGHARNALGVCIPENDCFPLSYCGSDLEYKKCGSSCAPSCADLDNLNPQPCTEECVEGCFCKNGYVKDDQGYCITSDKCRLPVCNKPNEVAKECGSYCEIRTCEDYNRTDISCPAVCVRGCFCRKGYVKNEYNICIPKEKCPRKPVCLQKNEEYQPCGSSCPDNCDNYKDTNRICTQNCVAACNCKAGYVRNLKDGTCIKPEQCPSKECTGENEVLNLCASYCPMQCVNRFNQGDRRCTTPCRKACDCIQGTVRNDNGTCVSREQCTPPVCRENEKYMKCGTPCPLTCDNYKNPPTCKPECTEDCFCKDGYVRDRFLRCVKPENCEPICPAGEKFNDCRAHCQDTCGNYNQTGRFCNYDLCRSGCVCEEGTVRRKDGQCVLPSQCPPNPICPVDEVFDPCSAHCEPTCEQYEANRPCTDICTPGCKCAVGLLRRKDGKCVKFEECYPLCPANERWEDCRIGLCRALSCDQLGFPIACPGILGPCRDGGCVCINNYVRDINNVCVPQQNCPSCGNDYNSTVGCGINCGRQCTDYKSPRNCKIPQPCRFNGCDCKKGYVYDVVTERCLAPIDCPIPCNGDVYKEKVKCPNPCAPTCARPTTKVCSKACLTEGCQCRIGYILDPNGKCVRPENCPVGLGCNGDPNARVGSCVTLCEPQCGVVPPVFCPAYCGLGCACKEGYLLSKNGDKCIKSEECANYTTTQRSYESSSPVPYEKPCSGSTRNVDTQAVAEGNAEAQASASYGAQQSTSLASKIPCGDVYADKLKCPNPCAATCTRPTTKICSKACLTEGCQCRIGYILDPNGKCVEPEDCPDGFGCNGDPNARVRSCVSVCEPQCGVGPRFCPALCRLGCACKEGYILSKTGDKCIKSEECPNDTTTESSYESSSPVPYEEALSGSTGSVDTQADAEDNAEAQAYASDGAQQSTSLASRKLILCLRDEIWINCKAGYCKPQYCRDAYKNLPCPPVAEPCPGGCICRDGLVRNEDGTCVPTDQCPIPCAYDPNAIRKECASPESCRPTCAVPNPNVCPRVCIINGCECKKGYVLSAKGGKCIRIQECPRGNVTCNGDHNAQITAFPQACPSTCALPNGIPNCLKLGLDVGCECKAVYLKSTDNGKCILASQCKGGDPCGAHETFSSCRFSCADSYCPVDDRRGIISCGNPRPCPSGCNCRPNYRRRSKEDDRCILASTCPPVNCTRPSEIWHPCPACLRENCEDVNNQPTTCNTLVYNCKPQCVCKKGHFRNNKGICVPAKDCPGNQPCDDQNAERLKCAPAPSCQPTCERPNPSPCILSCGINQCVCKKGFVLSAKGGKCITADQCPKDAPCNGDSNAVIKVNPIPCPSTCRAPNANPWCKKYVPPVGCECKPGFLLADNSGKCIKPNECPGGNPCGANSTFVWCRVSCPNDYCPVDDNRAIIACDPPYPCPNGCVCNLNYKRKSIHDETVCVLSSTCTPINCTRPNEIWDTCPSDCLQERCADVNNQPTTCNTLVLNCQPQCVCKKGFFRNDSDICVPENECPGQPCKDQNAERSKCAPAPSCRSTCAKPNPSPCILSCAVNQCVCKKGFVLSLEKGGKCIPVDQCPQVAPCNGDSNAVIKANPIPCPSTCRAPNASPWCKKYAPPVGCECKPGFLLAEDGGKCIKPDECPGGNPCGKNGTFVWCNFNCPTNNCPVSDTRAIIACSPPYPCPNGCACKVNYKRRSSSDLTCILASDCPAVNCTRPNELWSHCPSACLRERCTDKDAPPATCSTLVPNCQPKCICKKGYYRDDTDICIPAKECVNNQCNDQNAERVKCALAAECRPSCAVPNPGPCIYQICVKNECVCKKGYILSERGGKCITANQCQRIQCKENEVFRKIRIICPPQTCASIYTDYDCRNATKGEPGCDCINEYLRNGTENDLCIPSSQCPTTPPVIPDCGINEHYESNRNKCELTCKNYKLEHIMGPCQLTSGCFCDKGFVKNDNGLCIPKEKCPQNIICPKNEVVSQCYNTCHKTCKTRLRSDGRMCQLACIDTGCLCIEGYLRHENGTCVPISQCSPPRCNENEIYSSCSSACPATCQNRGDNCTACTAQCVEDCFCKKGFVRADDGTCMKLKDCPPRTCSDPNEVMDPCPPTCPPTDGCSNIWSKFNCTNAIKCCKPQCRCKSGYFRKDKGLCVPSSQC